MIEQAKLEFLKTHSAISILVQFVKQILQFLDESHHTCAEATTTQAFPPQAGWSAHPYQIQTVWDTSDLPWLWPVKPTCLVSFHPAMNGRHLHFLIPQTPIQSLPCQELAGW